MEKIAMEVMNWDANDLYNSSPVVSAKISGVPLVFLVDTGASVSFLDNRFLQTQPKLAQKIEDSHITHRSVTIGGIEESAKVLRTKTLTFLKEKYEHEFKVRDLNVSYDNEELVFHGILGFDFFLMHRAEFNFEKLILAIR